MSKVISALKLAGLDVRRAVNLARGLPTYLRDYRRFQRQSRGSGFPFGKPYPCFGDTQSSPLDYYFWQDLWVARRVFKAQPTRHVDVGSRIDGFVAHVAAFRAIEVMDIRPLPQSIPNVTFHQADLQASLPAHLTDYTDSLSCLHALEHFGLGRYGDQISYDGYLSGLANLHRLLQPNGKLYLSVPIGPQRIEFNAHRVFSVSYLLQLLDGDFAIDNFVYVDDQNRLHEDAPLTEENITTNFGCWMGCGIFELRKLI